MEVDADFFVDFHEPRWSGGVRTRCGYQGGDCTTEIFP